MVEQVHEVYVPYLGMALLFLGLVGSITGILLIVRRWIDAKLGAIQKDVFLIRNEMTTGQRCPMTGKELPGGLGKGNVSGKVQIAETKLAEKMVRMEREQVEEAVKKQQGVKIQVGGNG